MYALEQFAPNAWGAIPEKNKIEFKKDFEQGMAKLSIEQPHALPPLQRAMAAFFFKFTPQITNLYLRLANLVKLSKWNLKGSLVTFNYERLLLQALNANRIQPVGKPDANNQIEVCLPHGCCNLFCDSVRGNANNISFNGTAVKTNGEIRCIDNPFEFNNRIVNDAFPPVMSYFEPQKTTTSGNNFIMNQRNRYNELVLSASKIVLIGLKVRPHDSHIWESLAQTNAKVVYCSGIESCRVSKLGKRNPS